MLEISRNSEEISIDGVVYEVREVTMGDIFRLQKSFTSDNTLQLEDIVNSCSKNIVEKVTGQEVSREKIESFSGEAVAALVDIFERLNSKLLSKFREMQKKSE